MAQRNRFECYSNLAQTEKRFIVTLPTSPSNNMGGYYSGNTTPVTQGYLGIPTSVPSYIGTTDPPDAPDATSATAVAYISQWPYVNTELPVQNYTAAMVAARNNGTPFNFEGGAPPSPPGYNVAQTKPSGPGGSTGSQGTAALNAPNTFAGCLPANAVNSYKWQ
jgi:N-methylhydantoinase B/oxoprolinase/acetone carboxylase alpha subunit